jgi:hypothetical protein
MRPEPKYTVAASADIESAVMHYDAQYANFGMEFLDELERVTIHPRVAAPIDPRRYCSAGFPLESSSSPPPRPKRA